MKVHKAKITLEGTELERAIADYIEAHISPSVKCVGRFKFEKTTYSAKATVDVEPVGLNPLSDTNPDGYYKLRHKESGFFVDSFAPGKNGVIEFAVSYVGRAWPTINAIFNSLKNAARKDYPYTTTKPVDYNSVAIEQLREDLFEFEVVYFGECRVDDMTFHIDLLGKI